MTAHFRIGRTDLGKSPCYIIAEIGSNHDRSKKRALALIRASARAGADAVKFQLFAADRIAANIDLPQTRLTGAFRKFGRTVHDLYRDMELPPAWLKDLRACSTDNGVDFLATPFDERSADLLADLGVPAMKIASFEITHLPLLKHVARLGLPVLLSTGMASLREIRTAIEVVLNNGERRVALLHCGIQYPMPFHAVDLRCMETLRRTFRCPVGYSDHTAGITVPIAAAALGAALYEKHVTLPGGKSPDHAFALDAKTFAGMVEAMRDCASALGTGIKRVAACERAHLRRGRRSLFVVRDVARGERFSSDNIAVLRPGIGIPPGAHDAVIGRRARRDIRAPALLKKGDWA